VDEYLLGAIDTPSVSIGKGKMLGGCRQVAGRKLTYAALPSSRGSESDHGDLQAGREFALFSPDGDGLACSVGT